MRQSLPFKILGVSLASKYHLFKINVACLPTTHTLIQIKPPPIFLILGIWCRERQPAGEALFWALLLRDVGSWRPRDCTSQTTLNCFVTNGIS